MNNKQELNTTNNFKYVMQLEFKTQKNVYGEKWNKKVVVRAARPGVGQS